MCSVLRLIGATVLALLPFVASRGEAPAAARHANVALGKPYTLAPAPNYQLSTDPADSVQLTDGKYAGGGFWTEKAAVGWSLTRPVSVTIDLGQPTAVRGASFSTAAGRADVQWPGGLYAFCGIDGKSYEYLGDLVALDRARGAPVANNQFARHRFETHAFSARCRFVRIMIDVTGPYAFVDEVEVYGDAGAAPSPSRVQPDGPALYWKAHAHRRLRTMVEDALLDARGRLASAKLPGAMRSSLATRLDGLEHRIAQLGADDWWSARETFPVNAVHAGVLGVIGALEQVQGAPLLRAWATNPWEPLAMTSTPNADSASPVSVAMLNGEVRNAAVNVRNSSSQDVDVHFALSVGGNPRAAWMDVRTVAWTGDADARPVAAALQGATGDAHGSFTVPAGTTSQLWLTFAPGDLSEGVHRGALALSTAGGSATVPVKVEIMAGRMSSRLRLHLGGWDYLDRDGSTPEGMQHARKVAALLRTYQVDLPWATSTVMPFGRYDAAGRMTEPPDTSAFDAWVDLWPDAARYRVFIASGDRLSGLHRGAPAFVEAVRSWATFWAAHARKKGMPPERFDLLFVDEPSRPDQADRQIAWARALQASGSGLRVWVDPAYPDPTQVPGELVSTADAVCVNRRLLERLAGPYRAFANRVLAEGKSLEVYGTSGPTSQLDPYGYYRLQAWRAFDVGATAVSFWSFTDYGQGTAWREYVAPATVFSPLFPGRGSVVPGKHLAAILEGLEDYEYLSMLRDAIEEAARTMGPNNTAVTHARAVLSDSVQRVLGLSRPNDFSWSAGKDRSAADAARLEVAAELRRLSLSRASGR